MISIISSLIAAVSSLASIVGPAISSFATTLATKLPAIVTTIVKVANIIVDVAKLFGMLDSDEDALSFGGKVGQKGTRPRMDGESMEDYFKYLREEVELDKERLEKMSDEEKIECQIVGTAMVSQAISEKMDVQISPDFIVAMSKMAMTATQLEAYVNAFSKEGTDSMDYLTKFLQGNLSDKELVKVYNIVESVEKSLDPSLDENALQEKIDNMKSAIQQ